MALARLEPHTYVQSKDLAKQEQIPPKFLEAIMLTLRRAGLLDSKVGAGGGYRLSRALREISVGEVIRRLEGRLATKNTSPKTEASPGAIAVRLLADKLTSATDEVLDEMNLEQLLEHVAKAGTQANAMYYI